MRAVTPAERHVGDTIVYGFTLGSFPFAAFAYGATRDWAIRDLSLWLAIAAFLAVAKWIFVDLRWPRIPVVAAVLLLVANGLGWFMVWNARGIYDVLAERFIYLGNPLRAWPGSFDVIVSQEGMLSVSALSAGFFVLCDMTADPLWRKRLLKTLALTGALVAVLGITLKICGEPLTKLFWEDDKRWDTNFALYRYHGNAASYLNLTWPLAFALMLGCLGDKKRAAQSVGWGLCFGAIFGGCMINISKAGVAIATAMLLCFVVWRFFAFLRHRRENPLPDHEPKASVVARRVYLAVGFLLACGFAAFIAITATQDTSGWTRWRHISSEQPASIDQRLLSYQVSRKIIPDAGWAGTGVNTFAEIFPYYTGFLGDRLKGVWIYAHEDYLQAVIEWGWVGATLWGLLFLGGWLRGSWNFLQRANFSRSEDRLLLFACLLALGGIAVHATFDFPLQIASLRWYAFALLAVGWNAHRYGHETRGVN